MLTLSYLGAIRAGPYCNVTGLAKASLEANVRYMAASLGQDNIRVNGISAGPIKTPAVEGLVHFNPMLEYGEKNAPFPRNVTPDEVGNAAAFSCSDLVGGITDETLYVDSGYLHYGDGRSRRAIGQQPAETHPIGDRRPGVELERHR